MTVPYYDHDKMTAQEILQTAYDHIMKQGKPSVAKGPDGDMYCVYDDGNGCGCAAAPFVKPEHRYLKGSWLIFVDFNGYSPKHEKLILRIQDCHDDLRNKTKNFTKEFDKAMNTLAQRYNIPLKRVKP